MQGIDNIYGTFGSSIKFKHIVVLYLTFLGECNTICIFLVNTIIYLILIGDNIYCIYDIVSTNQEPYTTINCHIFLISKGNIQSLNPFTTNYQIIKNK